MDKLRSAQRTTAIKMSNSEKVLSQKKQVTELSIHYATDIKFKNIQNVTFHLVITYIVKLKQVRE